MDVRASDPDIPTVPTTPALPAAAPTAVRGTGQHRVAQAELIWQVPPSRRTGEVRTVQRTGEVATVERVGAARGSQPPADVTAARRTGDVRTVRSTGEMRTVRSTGEMRVVQRTGEVSVVKPAPMPGMFELTTVVRALGAETSLAAGAKRLERDACRLLQVTNALCVWIDWPRRLAMTADGRPSGHLEDLVIEVAGSGRRQVLGSTLIVPIGPAPARAVLALRKPSGIAFAAEELAVIETLAAGIAAPLDRLIAAAR